MTRQDIAKEITKELWSKSILSKRDIERIVLKKLTEILHKDKGRLTEGTIKE